MRTYVVYPYKQTKYLEMYTKNIIKNEIYSCNRVAMHNKFRKTRGKIRANCVQTLYGPTTNLIMVLIAGALIRVHCIGLNSCSQT